MYGQGVSSIQYNFYYNLIFNLVSNFYENVPSFCFIYRILNTLVPIIKTINSLPESENIILCVSIEIFISI